MTTSEMLFENQLRIALLNEPYDPIRGIGSPLERFACAISSMPEGTLMLPLSMKDDPLIRNMLQTGSLEKTSKILGVSPLDVIELFRAIRCCHDFEYWAAACVMIRTKRFESAQFLLNNPQRILLKEFERQRLARMPIRVILLKHRQWGGSTLTQLYIAWLQLFLRKGSTALIVGHVKDQSKHILQMFAKMLRMHPPEVFKRLYDARSFELTPYAGSSNYKMIKQREAVLGVGSVQEPDALRSQTVHMLHLSEVGSWKSNNVVNAESIAQALYGALVDEPLTLCVKESTAQGVGNYFHREWQRAVRKESNDAPVFIEWFRDTQYMIDPLTLEGITSHEQFIESWTEIERQLFDLGATVGHIAWRRFKVKDYTDLWRFQQEYPSTDDEAFTNTANRVFPLEYVKRARVTCTSPLFVGELSADSRTGKTSLQKISFSEVVGGNLSIWKKPHNSGLEKYSTGYRNRYCAFADVGGVNPKADYSSVTVLDRLPMLTGGVPEVVAEFHGHMDQDLFAWYVARLCTWYGKALLAIEINSLRHDNGDDERGYSENHSYTVLDEIMEHYDNFYYREQTDQMQARNSGKVGFHMNKLTKPMITDSLRAALRDGTYKEVHLEACDEFDTFMEFPDGKVGAVDGYHDDRVISRAGAIWISNGMDKVSEYYIPYVPKRPTFRAFIG